VSVVRELARETGRGIVERKREVLDLQSRQPAESDRAFMDVPLPVFDTVASLPFAALLD
jgi:hypothetical protein